MPLPAFPIGAKMIFSSTPGRRLRPWIVAALAAAALAACGGGTSQYEKFTPGRLLALGDEWSAITTDGKKYGINGLVTTTVDNITVVSDTPDCRLLPNWVQSIASHYGFVFAECNPANSASVGSAVMLAYGGAKVADISVQIDAETAAGGFRDGDLVTVLAGSNDIVELYQQFSGGNEPDLTTEAGNRGRALALQVNRLVTLGAKVLISTLPDLGVTAYAQAQKATNTDTDRAALLSRLTAAFNEQLGVNLLLDGRYVGLVQGDTRVQLMSRSPGSYGIANTTQAACLESAVVPDCTVKTLVDGGNIAWLWADGLRPGPLVHSQLAALAIDRATNNPF